MKNERGFFSFFFIFESCFLFKKKGRSFCGTTTGLITRRLPVAEIAKCSHGEVKYLAVEYSSTKWVARFFVLSFYFPFFSGRRGKIEARDKDPRGPRREVTVEESAARKAARIGGKGCRQRFF